MDTNSEDIKISSLRDDYVVNFLRNLVQDVGAQWIGIQTALLPTESSKLVFINPKTAHRLFVPFRHEGFSGSTPMLVAVSQRLAEDTQNYTNQKAHVERAQLRKIADSLSALASELRDIYDGRSK